MTVNLSFIKQIKVRTEALRQIVLMIDYIEISIKYQSLNIKDIFNQLRKSKKYNLLTFINSFVENNNLECDFNTLTFRKSFSSYTLQLLNGFFSMLGKSDIDGQIINCETYKCFFKDELQKTEANEERTIKTGTAIFFCIALFILILLI